MLGRAVRWGLVVTLACCGCGSEDPQPEPQPTPGRGAAPRAADVDRPHEHDDPIDARLVLVAGHAGTASHRLAHALQNAARQEGEDLSISPSASDTDPLYLVAWGHADAGIVPGNVLASPLHRLAREGVEVIGVFDAADEVHVVVAEASPMQVVADLQGKVLSVGRLGSASHLAAQDLLLAAGLDADGGDVTLEHGAPQDALERLGRGVDAVIMAGHCGDVPGAPRTRLLRLASDDAAAVAGGYDRAERDGGSALLVRAVVVARPAAKEVARRIAGVPGTGLIDSRPPQTVDGPAMASRKADGTLRLATGPAGGTYQKVAEGVARVLETTGLGRAELVPTQGAFESFVLLATGQVDVAIVKEDVLEDALRTPAVAPLIARTRLLTPLYREEVHLAVSVSGKVTGLADLRGKKVVLGEAGSGTYATARRVLQLAGLGRGDVSGRALAPQPALDALRAGRVDAVFFVGGQPVGVFAGSNVEFAPIGSSLEGYVEGALTKESYGWLAEPVPTVATRALLLCRRDLASDMAEKLVDGLYANRRNLLSVHPKFAELEASSLEQERPGLKLHPAVKALAGQLAPDSAADW